ncbi:MAG TPA: nuclear transport factor 2 family protein [Desulfuromonadales bacterium]|nr:nuclear transport factor 2 family protein [Desulfuromonadales bacterium]
MAARIPEEVDKLFAQAFSAGDLQALVALYEPDATLVPQQGQTVTGTAAIREALQGFLSLCGEFRIEVKSVIPAGDLALVRSDWSLVGTAPGGCLIDLAGRGVEVVRRQPDGTWLYVIDNPFGGNQEPVPHK